jgi:hypothetical protein
MRTGLKGLAPHAKNNRTSSSSLRSPSLVARNSEGLFYGLPEALKSSVEVDGRTNPSPAWLFTDRAMSGRDGYASSQFLPGYASESNGSGAFFLL